MPNCDPNNVESYLNEDLASPHPPIGAIQGLGIPHLERLVKARGMSVKGITRNIGRRQEVLRDMLLKHEAKTGIALKAEADNMIEADRVVYALANLAQAQPAIDPEGIVDQRSTKPASASLIQKFAGAVRAIKVLGKEESKRISEALGKKNTRLEQLFTKIRDGDVQQPARLVNRILSGAVKDLKAAQSLGGVINQAELSQLVEHIVGHPESKRLHPRRLGGMLVALNAFVNYNVLPSKDDAMLMAAFLGPDVTSAMELRVDHIVPFWQKVLNFINMPRQLLSTGDLSAAGRQGFAALVAHPIRGLRDIGLQAHAFASEVKAIQLNDMWLGDRRLQRLIQDFGLEFAAFESVGLGLKLSEQEEIYRSNTIATIKKMAEAQGIKVPAWATLLQSSERAFVTMLNSQRYWMSTGMFQSAVEEGFDPNNPEHKPYFEDIAKFVNASTGRANLKSLSSPLANGLFFAPRYFASRIEHLFFRLPKSAIFPGGRKGPTALRREAQRQLVSMSLFWGSVFIAAGMAAKWFGWEDDEEEGIEFETNPLSSDFLKLRLGPNRIDFAGGYGQIIRMVYGFATGMASISEDRLYMDPKTGKEMRATGFSDPRNAWNTLVREALLAKLAPVPSMAISVAQGSFAFTGDPITPSRVLENLIVPLTFGEIDDFIKENGALGLAFVFPEMLGFSSKVHTSDPSLTFGGVGNFMDRAIGMSMFGNPYVFDPKGSHIQALLEEPKEFEEPKERSVDQGTEIGR